MYSQLKQNKLLSELSTFAIGGPARFFFEAKTIDQMCEIIRFCHHEKMPYLVIGKGSNCLFDSQGFDGLVILNKIDFCQELNPGTFYVGAGHSFSLLGRNSAMTGWTGLEFAAGIPASVGGAVYMNAGAQGMQTQDTLSFVEFVDETGRLTKLDMQSLSFAYRNSCFQEKKGAIVAACFSLKASCGARAEQLKLLEYRIRTQPYSEKSCGCIFRNPEGGSAGALIDRLGLKGCQIGGARISEMHANFIVNSKKATSRDVLELIDHIKKKAQEIEKVALEIEIRIIPYSLQNLTCKHELPI